MEEIIDSFIFETITVVRDYYCCDSLSVSSSILSPVLGKDDADDADVNNNHKLNKKQEYDRETKAFVNLDAVLVEVRQKVLDTIISSSNTISANDVVVDATLLELSNSNFINNNDQDIIRLSSHCPNDIIQLSTPSMKTDDSFSSNVVDKNDNTLDCCSSNVDSIILRAKLLLCYGTMIRPLLFQTTDTITSKEKHMTQTTAKNQKKKKTIEISFDDAVIVFKQYKIIVSSLVDHYKKNDKPNCNILSSNVRLVHVKNLLDLLNILSSDITIWTTRKNNSNVQNTIRRRDDVDLVDDEYDDHTRKQQMDHEHNNDEHDNFDKYRKQIKNVVLPTFLYLIAETIQCISSLIFVWDCLTNDNDKSNNNTYIELETTTVPQKSNNNVENTTNSSSSNIQPYSSSIKILEMCNTPSTNTGAGTCTIIEQEQQNQLEQYFVESISRCICSLLAFYPQKWPSLPTKDGSYASTMPLSLLFHRIDPTIVGVLSRVQSHSFTGTCSHDGDDDDVIRSERNKNNNNQQDIDECIPIPILMSIFGANEHIDDNNDDKHSHLPQYVTDDSCVLIQPTIDEKQWNSDLIYNLTETVWKHLIDFVSTIRKFHHYQNRNGSHSTGTCCIPWNRTMVNTESTSNNGTSTEDSSTCSNTNASSWRERCIHFILNDVVTDRHTTEKDSDTVQEHLDISQNINLEQMQQQQHQQQQQQLYQMVSQFVDPELMYIALSKSIRKHYFGHDVVCELDNDDDSFNSMSPRSSVVGTMDKQQYDTVDTFDDELHLGMKIVHTTKKTKTTSTIDTNHTTTTSTSRVGQILGRCSYEICMSRLYSTIHYFSFLPQQQQQLLSLLPSSFNQTRNTAILDELLPICYDLLSSSNDVVVGLGATCLYRLVRCCYFCYYYNSYDDDDDGDGDASFRLPVSQTKRNYTTNNKSSPMLYMNYFYEIGTNIVSVLYDVIKTCRNGLTLALLGVTQQLVFSKMLLEECHNIQDLVEEENGTNCLSSTRDKQHQQQRLNIIEQVLIFKQKRRLATQQWLLILDRNRHSTDLRLVLGILIGGTNRFLYQHSIDNNPVDAVELGRPALTALLPILRKCYDDLYCSMNVIQSATIVSTLYVELGTISALCNTLIAAYPIMKHHGGKILSELVACIRFNSISLNRRKMNLMKRANNNNTMKDNEQEHKLELLVLNQSQMLISKAEDVATAAILVCQDSIIDNDVLQDICEKCDNETVQLIDKLVTRSTKLNLGKS